MTQKLLTLFCLNMLSYRGIFERNLWCHYGSVNKGKIYANSDSNIIQEIKVAIRLQEICCSIVYLIERIVIFFTKIAIRFIMESRSTLDSLDSTVPTIIFLHLQNIFHSAILNNVL